jgi:imidazolonepropionase-like amidohydrolase
MSLGVYPLLSATSIAARGLGKSGEIGTLEQGKFANMVFLTEDPTTDIGALRSVTLTVKRGHRFVREEYKAQDHTALSLS